MKIKNYIKEEEEITNDFDAKLALHLLPECCWVTLLFTVFININMLHQIIKLILSNNWKKDLFVSKHIQETQKVSL